MSVYNSTAKRFRSMNILINNPLLSDREELEAFYRFTITDTFDKNHIDDPEGIIDEIKHQMKTYANYFKTRGKEDFLLIAKKEKQIIGTIAYGKMNKSVRNNIPESLREIKEIKCAYVHPDFQNQGIGNRLWQTVLSTMKKEKIERACLDSSYKISQKFWTRKIGNPTIFMKDYWGEGEHQLIWFFHIDEVLPHLPKQNTTS